MNKLRVYWDFSWIDTPEQKGLTSYPVLDSQRDADLELHIIDSSEEQPSSKKRPRRGSTGSALEILHRTWQTGAVDLLNGYLALIGSSHRGLPRFDYAKQNGRFWRLLHETVGNRISKSLLQQVKELHDWISMGLDRVVPDAEVYHSFHPQSELLPILHHAIQNQRPLFLTLPDDPEFPLDPGSLGVQKTNLKVRFEYEVLKVALAYSPRIWIQREEQREILHGLGIRPDRIRTAPFGLSRGIMEVDSFTSPRRMRSRLGIGVLGPLHPAADFRTVFAAFAEMPHKSIGPKLTIFADPSDNPTYWQEILFTAQSVGVQNAFVLQSPDNLAHHIHSIDILVLPSLVKSNYREVLFCWRNRVIPLVPRVSWARNLLDDTDWSTYNPYDYRNLATQITRLAEDPYRARNLAEENAKRSRDHYAPGQVIREYAKAYRQEVTAPSLAFLPRVANFQLDRRF